jgi:hypothetical protein
MSTSIYGNAVALTESPLVEGLLYVGTDDGLIHVTSDGGDTWRTMESFPGVPELSYVAELEASQHDADTVYATFDNHKMGDFKPYVLKSMDRGQTWTDITGDLPERGMVWTLAQDHVKPDLLFAGTELSLFVTLDEGEHWVELSSGLPTIAVRDLEIQRRENDLALGTFGRGFYILDNYAPLRELSAETLDQDAAVFPVKDALRYIETARLGLPTLAKAFQGDTFYVAPNPPYGAVFTYYLKETVQTRQEHRLEAEKAAREEGTTADYPTIEELRAEDEEHEPRMLLVVRDTSGEVVQRVEGPRQKGIHRVAWNLRYPATTPTDLASDEPAPWETPEVGPLALPGTYTVTLEQEVGGEVTQLTEPVSFQVKNLDLGSPLTADDPTSQHAFQEKAAELARAVDGAVKAAGEVSERVKYLRKAIIDTPDAEPERLEALASIEADLNDLLIGLRGDRTRASRNEPVPPSTRGRVHRIMSGQLFTTQPPTGTHRQLYEWASGAFTTQLETLRGLVDRLESLETQLEDAGAPWTPGRIPDWSDE